MSDTTQRFSVRAFGARGDGIHDDTAAINKCVRHLEAVSAKENTSVFFPPGTYLLDSSAGISLFEGCVVEGAGDESIIKTGAETPTATRIGFLVPQDIEATFKCIRFIAPTDLNGQTIKGISAETSPSSGTKVLTLSEVTTDANATVVTASSITAYRWPVVNVDSGPSTLSSLTKYYEDGGGAGGGGFPTAAGSVTLPAWYFEDADIRDYGVYDPGTDDRIAMTANSEQIHSWGDYTTSIAPPDGDGPFVLRVANEMFCHPVNVAGTYTETSFLYMHVNTAVQGTVGGIPGNAAATQVHGIYIELDKQASPLVDGTAIKVMHYGVDDAIYVAMYGSNTVGYEAAAFGPADGHRGFIATKQAATGTGLNFVPFVALWRNEFALDGDLLSLPNFGLYVAQNSPGRSFVHIRNSTITETAQAYLITDFDTAWNRWEIYNDGQQNMFAKRASATDTFNSAPSFNLVTTYWDGAAQFILGSIKHVQASASATDSTLQFSVGATTIMSMAAATITLNNASDIDFQATGDIIGLAALSMTGILAMANTGTLVQCNGITMNAAGAHVDLQGGDLQNVNAAAISGIVSMANTGTITQCNGIVMNTSGANLDMQGGNQLAVGTTTYEAGASDPSVRGGTADPSAAAGVAASEGSLYLRYVSANGQLWVKTGAADTAWTDASAGGGGTTHAAGVDNQIARYNGTSAIQGSGVTLSDTDDLTGVGSLTMDGGSTLSGLTNITLASGAGGTIDLQTGSIAALAGITMTGALLMSNTGTITQCNGLTMVATTGANIDLQTGNLLNVTTIDGEPGGLIITVNAVTGITINAGEIAMQTGVITDCGNVTMNNGTTLAGLQNLTFQSGAGGTIDLAGAIQTNGGNITMNGGTSLTGLTSVTLAAGAGGIVDLQGGTLISVASTTYDAGASDPSVRAGTADPSAAAGVAANEGSLYLRYVSTDGQLWLKTGAAATAWTDLAITAHTASVDNRVARYNGTDGIQGSGMTIDDSDNLTGVADLTMDAASTLSGLKHITLQAGAGGTVDLQTGVITQCGGLTMKAAGGNVDLQGGSISNTAIITTTGAVNIGGTLNHDGSNVGFYGTAPNTKQTITGSRSSNVALANLLTGLVNIGLIADSTT